jgi:hypothetical protein
MRVDVNIIPPTTQNKVELFIMPTPCVEAYVLIFKQDPTNPTTTPQSSEQVFSGQTTECKLVFDMPVYLTVGAFFAYKADSQGYQASGNF